MIETSMGGSRAGVIRGRLVRIAVEAVTLVLLVAPPVWLAFHWPWIPVGSPHLRHSRMFLWVMPTFAFASYVMFSEFGLLSRMDILRHGHRLSGLRPIFRAYTMTLRLELLAFLAVLGLAMDRAAMTGRRWSAKGFFTASITVMVITVLLFLVMGTRAGYTLARPVPKA